MPAPSKAPFDTKPSSLADYVRWLSTMHGVNTSAAQTHYETVAGRMKASFEEGDIWMVMLSNLSAHNAEYQIKTGYQLLAAGPAPELLVKPYESFLLKTFRRNVIDNRAWPQPPQDGWLLPPHWHSRIHDILRTMLVVKYLDGVSFLADKLTDDIAATGHTCQTFYEAREEGYYAAHLYLAQSFDVPTLTWATERIEASIEIQLTTQLQEVIRKLTHKFYEERRTRLNPPSTKWQWNYRSEEFVANYLGHILHYIEGMIMEVRDEQRARTK